MENAILLLYSLVVGFWDSAQVNKVSTVLLVDELLVLHVNKYMSHTFGDWAQLLKELHKKQCHKIQFLGVGLG